MTTDEIPMTKECRSTSDQFAPGVRRVVGARLRVLDWASIIPSSFDFRRWSFLRHLIFDIRHFARLLNRLPR